MFFDLSEAERIALTTGSNMLPGPRQHSLGELAKMAERLMMDPEDGGLGMTNGDVKKMWGPIITKQLLDKAVHHAESDVKDRRVARAKEWVREQVQKGKMLMPAAIKAAAKRWHMHSKTLERKLNIFPKDRIVRDRVEEEVRGLAGGISLGFKQVNGVVEKSIAKLSQAYIEDKWDISPVYIDKTFKMAETNAKKLVEMIAEERKRFKAQVQFGDN